MLRAPAGPRERGDPALHPGLVRVEVLGAPRQYLERRLRDELRGVERLVHPVPGERIDEPGRVADHRRRPAREARSRQPHRQPVAASFLRRVRIDPVLLAHPAQLGTQLRRLLTVPADADVDVAPLGEDPAVAAADDRDLEHHRARVALLVRIVRLERDTVCDAVGEPELLRRLAVAAVGADHDPRVELPRVGRLPLSHLGTRVGRLLQEEVVEPPPLRHVREWRAGLARDALPIAEAALQPVGDVLHDGLDRERQHARRAPRDTAPAGLVAREGRLVEEQDARARIREAVGGGRARRPGSDDRDVVAHALRLRHASGTSAERRS
jgi:hypothetical protein